MKCNKEWDMYLADSVMNLKTTNKGEINTMIRKLPWKAWIEEQDDKKYVIFNQIENQIYVVFLYKENKKLEVQGKIW